MWEIFVRGSKFCVNCEANCGPLSVTSNSRILYLENTDLIMLREVTDASLMTSGNLEK